MFQKIWSCLNFIFNDKGEVDPATGLETEVIDDKVALGPDGQPIDSGKKEAGTGATGGPAGGGEPKPDPTDIFGGDYGKATKSYRELSAIHKPMEMENAALKKQLGTLGVKVVKEGNELRLVIDESKKPTEKQKRFTEEHMGQFGAYFDKPESGKAFYELLKLAVQDLIDDGVEGHFTQREKIYSTAVAFKRAERETEEFIKKVYPDADPDKEDFPETGTPLFNRAKEIYDANEDYGRHPKGQLWAVHEAAIELGIAPQAITKAKAEGRKEAIENKRILNKMGGGEKGGGGVVGEMSNEDFIKMTPTQRREWQQNQMKKKQGG